MKPSEGVLVPPAYFTAVQEAHASRSALAALLDTVIELKEYVEKYSKEDSRMLFILSVLDKGLDNAVPK